MQDQLEKKSTTEKTNFEVHTMPQKFLSTRPVAKSSKSKKPHKTMGLKTNLIIGLIVIVLFAGLLALAAWLFLRSFNEPKPQPILPAQNNQLNDTQNLTEPVLATTTLDNLEEQQRLAELLDTTNWQTVESEQWHYSFKFPMDWQKETPATNDEEAEIVIIKDNEGIEYLKLLTLDSEEMTLEDWLSQGRLLPEDLQPFTLNGQVGYKIDKGQEALVPDDPFSSFIADNRYSIFIIYQDTLYELSFIKTDDQVINQLSNKILINFKFIEVEKAVIDPEAPVYVPSADSDHDGLTDVEEILYGSDKLKRDTDGDSYTDGEEVANLYDPLIAGNVKIYEKDVAATYVNADYHYNLIYPATWKVTDDQDSVIFQSSTGEFIQVLITANDDSYNNITNWYQANINSDIKNLTHLSISGIPAIRTADGYKVYFLLGDNIYSLLYNINLRQDANFMTTFDMVIKSFKLMTA